MNDEQIKKTLDMYNSKITTQQQKEERIEELARKKIEALNRIADTTFIF
jgi:hypothetical protein